jgi:ABC-type bacteriocin/lantibiotic exporter with double-glycine peptidase domain
MARILYKIPTFVQQGQNTCWLACLRMLALYRHNRGRRLNDSAELLLNDDFVQHFRDLDRQLAADAFRRVATRFAMSAIRVPGFTQREEGELTMPGGLHTLQTRGPFLFAGQLPGGAGHAIVINGWDTSNGEQVLFVDPRFGSYRQLPFRTFAEGFPPLGAPLLVF